MLSSREILSLIWENKENCLIDVKFQDLVKHIDH